MKAILYLYFRTFTNRLKKAVRKPITYFYLILVLVYAVLIPITFRTTAANMNMDSPSGITAVFTVFAFWVIPANLNAFAKRKGLLYRSSDIHFLFPAPVSPKQILLYAHLRTLPTTLIMNLFMTVAGGYIFRVEWWKMLLYFLFSVIVENILEAGIMILVYGNEKLDEKGRAWIVRGAYAIVGVFLVMGVFAYLTGGMSFETVMNFLHSDMVQMVPLVGWYIAVLHLLFMGPAAVNVICSVLYLILAAAVVWMAWRMKCTGEYYEDAMKFADDYEEVLVSRKQGRTDVRMGKKKKFGKASVVYRGSGAKAIFYRQLLEYKKNRFFIFDMNTVMSLMAGAVIAVLYLRGELGNAKNFVIPGVMAYLIFIFTAYNGKWGKELTSPYTFLIPDNAFSKLMYATAMHHIQALVNGCIFAVPCSLIMGLPPVTIVCSVIAYVTLNACKLYSLTVTEVLVGNVMGRVGKQLMQMLLMGIAITVGAMGAVMGMALGNLAGAYLMMSAMLAGMTAILMTISSLAFYRMETTE